MSDQKQINDLASELMQSSVEDCIEWMEGDIVLFRKTNCPSALIKTFEDRVAKLKGNLNIAREAYIS